MMDHKIKNTKNFWNFHLIFILLILLLTNCTRVILVEEVSEYRDKLTYTELMNPDYKSSGHVHNSYFAPMGDATHALHDLEGTLTAPQVEMKIKSLKYEADLLESYFFHYFPGFSVSFFTYKDYLIPVNQVLLEAEGSHKAWAPQSGLAGAGFKPPQAAVVKSPGGERWGKVAALDRGR